MRVIEKTLKIEIVWYADIDFVSLCVAYFSGGEFF